MAAISLKQFEELENGYVRMKARVAKVKAAADEAVATVVATAEVSTAAFGMGLVDGRWGGVEVVGIPLSLGLAAGSHLVGFLGVQPEHMHNFGNGFLASYVNNLGTGVGARMAQEQLAAARAMAAATPA